MYKHAGCALRADGLSFSFGHKAILDDVSFKTQSDASIYGIFGPNGSGKTTVLNLLSGILSPMKGKIVLYGEEIIPDPYKVSLIGRGLRRTFQTPVLIEEMSLVDNLLVGRRGRGERFCDWLLPLRSELKTEANEQIAEACRWLGRFGFSNPWLNASDLSMGMRRLLSLLQAVFSGAGILLLDEPFANLNIGLVSDLKEFIKEITVRGNRTVVLVEHMPDNFPGFADMIWLLQDGHMHSIDLREGSPRETVRRLRQELFVLK